MLSNQAFTKEKILKTHKIATNTRNQENILIAIQGTTTLNYDTHKKIKDPGYNCEQTLEINVHSCLLLTPKETPSD